MIKLTQIFSTTKAVTHVAPGVPVVQKEYFLKDIWVNPSFFLLLEEDEQLNADHEREQLIEGLDKRVGFSKLSIADKSYSKQLFVVGHPKVILTKMRDNDE
tara:strand:- start:1628 stop:1930 length:303 start_codon:yes stop_codon:yes gene_type:complete